jgi:hypothetical protein
VVAKQRAATVRALQDYTRLKAQLPPKPATAAELSWQLVLESLIFDADAEVRWLDHCEARLVRVGSVLPVAPPAEAPAPAVEREVVR